MERECSLQSYSRSWKGKRPSQAPSISGNVTGTRAGTREVIYPKPRPESSLWLKLCFSPKRQTPPLKLGVTQSRELRWLLTGQLAGNWGRTTTPHSPPPVQTFTDARAQERRPHWDARPPTHALPYALSTSLTRVVHFLTGMNLHGHIIITQSP